MVQIWSIPLTKECFFIFKALFVKIVVFKTKLFKVDWSGKRASGVEINHNSLPGKYVKTAIFKKRIGYSINNNNIIKNNNVLL